MLFLDITLGKGEYNHFISQRPAGDLLRQRLPVIIFPPLRMLSLLQQLLNVGLQFHLQFTGSIVSDILVLGSMGLSGTKMARSRCDTI